MGFIKKREFNDFTLYRSSVSNRTLHHCIYSMLRCPFTLLAIVIFSSLFMLVPVAVPHEIQQLHPKETGLCGICCSTMIPLLFAMVHIYCSSTTSCPWHGAAILRCPGAAWLSAVVASSSSKYIVVLKEHSHSMCLFFLVNGGLNVSVSICNK